MFRPSDQRRVQAAFDAALPAPYEAFVKLEADRTVMRVSVPDPDNELLPVAQAVWTYDASVKDRKQPTDEELAQIGARFAVICAEYTGT